MPQTMSRSSSQPSPILAEKPSQQASLHSSSPEARNSTEQEQVTSNQMATTDEPLRRVKTNPPMSLIREILLVMILCSAQLLTQAALGQVVAPLHITGRNFSSNPSPGILSWYPAAYSLTVGTFILPSGRLGDTFGHRLLFLIGYAWVGFWSLIAGFAAFIHTHGGSIFFSVCRAMQGIGPAIILPNAIALISRTYAGERRNIILSLMGATAPGGFLIGAAFSSLLAEREWWPWAYWILAIVCFALVALSWSIIPVARDDDNEEEEVSSQVAQASLVKRLDVLGAVTGVAGLVLVNFAWNQGPVVGWSTVYVYVLFIVGVLILAAFAYIETHVQYPLVPIKEIHGDAGFVLGCIAAGWSSFGIWVFYNFQFVEILEKTSPLLATARFTPAAISGLIAAVVAGKIISRVVPGAVMLASMTAFTVGTILLATRPVGQIYWAQLFVSIVVTPWGMDLSFPSGTIIMSDALPRSKQGLAASLVTTVVNYSISIGLGAAGLVESRTNDHGKNLLGGYRNAWYLGIGLGGIGIVISFYFTLSGIRKRKIERTKSPLHDDVEGEEKRIEAGERA